LWKTKKKITKSNPDIKLTEKIAYADGSPLKGISMNDLEENIVSMKLPDHGIIAFEPNSHYVYLTDSKKSADKLHDSITGKSDDLLPMFPIRGALDSNKKFWNKNMESGVIGIIWFVVKEDNIFIQMMATHPHYKRNGVMSILISWITQKYPGLPVDFGYTSTAGEMVAKKFVKKGGSRIKRQLNPKPLNAYLEMFKVFDEMLLKVHELHQTLLKAKFVGKFTNDEWSILNLFHPFTIHHVELSVNRKLKLKNTDFYNTDIHNYVNYILNSFPKDIQILAILKYYRAVMALHYIYSIEIFNIPSEKNDLFYLEQDAWEKEGARSLGMDDFKSIHSFLKAYEIVKKELCKTLNPFLPKLQKYVDNYNNTTMEWRVRPGGVFKAYSVNAVLDEKTKEYVVDENLEPYLQQKVFERAHEHIYDSETYEAPGPATKDEFAKIQMHHRDKGVEGILEHFSYILDDLKHYVDLYKTNKELYRPIIDFDWTNQSPESIHRRLYIMVKKLSLRDDKKYNEKFARAIETVELLPMDNNYSWYLIKGNECEFEAYIGSLSSSKLEDQSEEGDEGHCGRDATATYLLSLRHKDPESGKFTHYATVSVGIINDDREPNELYFALIQMKGRRNNAINPKLWKYMAELYLSKHVRLELDAVTMRVYKPISNFSLKWFIDEVPANIAKLVGFEDKAKHSISDIKSKKSKTNKGIIDFNYPENRREELTSLYNKILKVHPDLFRSPFKDDDDPSHRNNPGKKGKTSMKKRIKNNTSEGISEDEAFIYRKFVINALRGGDPISNSEFLLKNLATIRKVSSYFLNYLKHYDNVEFADTIYRGLVLKEKGKKTLAPNEKFPYLSFTESIDVAKSFADPHGPLSPLIGLGEYGYIAIAKTKDLEVLFHWQLIRPMTESVFTPDDIDFLVSQKEYIVLQPTTPLDLIPYYPKKLNPEDDKKTDEQEKSPEQQPDEEIDEFMNDLVDHIPELWFKVKGFKFGSERFKKHIKIIMWAQGVFFDAVTNSYITTLMIYNLYDNYIIGESSTVQSYKDVVKLCLFSRSQARATIMKLPEKSYAERSLDFFDRRAPVTKKLYYSFLSDRIKDFALTFGSLLLMDDNVKLVDFVNILRDFMITNQKHDVLIKHLTTEIFSNDYEGSVDKNMVQRVTGILDSIHSMAMTVISKSRPFMINYVGGDSKYVISEDDVAEAYNKHEGNYALMEAELIPGVMTNGKTLFESIKFKQWFYKYPKKD
jgi:hypothetical protein